MPTHPKIVSAGKDGLALYVRGGCWSAEHFTDGFLPESVIALFTYDMEIGARGMASIMVGAGLWERVDGGYRIHDYLDYNPSQEGIQAAREEQKSKAAAGGSSRARNAARGADGRMLPRTVQPPLQPELQPAAQPERQPGHQPETSPVSVPLSVPDLRSRRSGIDPSAQPFLRATAAPGRSTSTASPASKLSARESATLPSDSGFGQFWEIHPKRRESFRGEALRAWGAINPSSELAGRICRALQYQLRQARWTEQDGRYVPRPDVYLADRIFEQAWRDVPVGRDSFGWPQCAMCRDRLPAWKPGDPGRCPDCLRAIGAPVPEEPVNATPSPQPRPQEARS
jgi:hypothetical protein